MKKRDSVISIESLFLSKYVLTMLNGFYRANWKEIRIMWKFGEITAKAAMEQTHTKRTSFYKPVGRMEENQ